MRTIAVALLLLTATAAADKQPLGSLGVVVPGVIAGTGADNKRIGEGLLFGGQAAFNPMWSDQLGWSLRASTMFGILWNGSASHIDNSLRTVQMDLTIGLRYWPYKATRHFLTARFGGELLRANEPIPNDGSLTGQRAYAGFIGEVGFDQYLGPGLLSFDVRYGLIPIPAIGGSGPQSLSFMVGIAVTGP